MTKEEISKQSTTPFTYTGGRRISPHYSPMLRSSQNNLAPSSTLQKYSTSSHRTDRFTATSPFIQSEMKLYSPTSSKNKNLQSKTPATAGNSINNTMDFGASSFAPGEGRSSLSRSPSNGMHASKAYVEAMKALQV